MEHRIQASLYDEFASLSDEHRCRFAPGDPRRLFNLAFDSIYPSCRESVSPWEFLGLMYRVLEGTNGRNGLFHVFDPERYHGELRLEDHFKNMFASRLVSIASSTTRRRGRRTVELDGSSSSRAYPTLCG